MSQPFEQGLRRAMEFLGRIVERLIGTAKHAKVQVAARGGLQPLVSLEGFLSTARIRDIVDASISRVAASAIPDLRNGPAIEVGEGPAPYESKLLARGAGTVVSVELGGASIGRQGDVSRGFVIRGQVSRLPFSNGVFSYFLARLATHHAGDMARDARELGRVLAPGGQGILIDYHPFGQFTKRGSGRLRSADSGVAKLEDYYRLAREASLRVVDVREAFIDETMRQLFKPEEIQAYRNLKGTPLLIFLFVYKPKGKA